MVLGNPLPPPTPCCGMLRTYVPGDTSNEYVPMDVRFILFISVVPLAAYKMIWRDVYASGGAGHGELMRSTGQIGPTVTLPLIVADKALLPTVGLWVK